MAHMRKLSSLIWAILLLITIGSVSGQRRNQRQQQQNKFITIGALLDNNDILENKVLDFTERAINREQNTLRYDKLRIHTSTVANSFDTANKVCAMANENPGIAAVVGPYDAMSSDYVRSFSSTFKIPHVQIHPDFTQHTKEALDRSVSLNFFPDVNQIALAYQDLKDRFRWKKVIIITSMDQRRGTGFLPFLKHMMEYEVSKNEDVIVRGVQDNEEAVKILTSFGSFKNVIVDLPVGDCVDFVRKASQAELMSGYYHFHFTNMDMVSVQEEIKHLTVGLVNVTAFSIVDFTSHEYERMMYDWKEVMRLSDFSLMSMAKYALMYDSLYYVTSIMAAQIERDPAFATSRAACTGASEPTPWRYGEMLFKQMTLNITRTYRGVSGEIKLDADGKRRNFRLTLLEFDSEGKVQKVGHWRPDGVTLEERLVITKKFENVKEDVKKDFQKRKFVVAVKVEEPFVMVSDYYDRENKTRLIPKENATDRFYGFNIDMWKEIRNRLNIKNFEFVIVTEGSSRKKDGSYSGIIGGLMTNKYDIGLSPITVTVERSQVVDFSQEYLSVGKLLSVIGISILYKRPKAETIGLFQFMQPFKPELWGAIFAAFLATSFVLHIIGRFSPGQWDNPHPCSPEVELLENDLTPSNCLWFTMGSFLQQGTEIMPKSGATRIIASFWWLFCLICVASYTANLAAFLTKSKMKLQINNADDLARQTAIKYGCFAGGSTRSFFQNSKISTYTKMNAFMEETNNEYNKGSTDEGLKAVKEGDGNTSFAYIMESVPLRYLLSQDCELMEIGKELNSNMYSLALPKGSPYTRDISNTILAMSEDQVILNLYNKHWGVGDNKCAEENKVVSAVESSKLGLKNFKGVFLVLAVLLFIGLVVLIIEFFVGAYHESKDKGVSYCEAFCHHFMFSLNCCWGEDEKPVAWTDEKESENESDDFEGSLDRLSLSIGSLNTSTIPAWSTCRSEPRSRPDSQRLNSRKYNSMLQNSNSSSNNSLDLTKDTNVSDSTAPSSLITVRDNMANRMSSL